MEVSGEVFRRDLLYAAKVFAERPGTYRIDPIKLRIKYLQGRANHNPFRFNLSLQRMATANIQSRQVKVEVRPLPPAPAGSNFTGLVGKHTFKLLQAKNRYLG